MRRGQANNRRSVDLSAGVTGMFKRADEQVTCFPCHHVHRPQCPPPYYHHPHQVQHGSPRDYKLAAGPELEAPGLSSLHGGDDGEKGSGVAHTQGASDWGWGGDALPMDGGELEAEAKDGYDEDYGDGEDEYGDSQGDSRGSGVGREAKGGFDGMDAMGMGAMGMDMGMDMGMEREGVGSAGIGAMGSAASSYRSNRSEELASAPPSAGEPLPPRAAPAAAADKHEDAAGALEGERRRQADEAKYLAYRQAHGLPAPIDSSDGPGGGRHGSTDSEEEQVVVAAGAGLRAVRAASELSRQLNGEGEGGSRGGRSGGSDGAGMRGGGGGLGGMGDDLDGMEAELARLQAEQDRLQREGDDMGADFGDMGDLGGEPRAGAVVGKGRRLVQADGDLAMWLCRLADTARETIVVKRDWCNTGSPHFDRLPPRLQVHATRARARRMCCTCCTQRPCRTQRIHHPPRITAHHPPPTPHHSSYHNVNPPGMPPGPHHLRHCAA